MRSSKGDRPSPLTGNPPMDAKAINAPRMLSIPMEFSLTIKFRGAEAELLNHLVRSGLFETKSDAVRAAIVKYGADLGLLQAKDVWSAIKASPKRHVSLTQLRRDVRKGK